MHKHSGLFDIIRVCSVLPALAIMPAMADGEIKNLNETYPDGVVNNKLHANGENMSLTTENIKFDTDATTLAYAKKASLSLGDDATQNIAIEAKPDVSTAVRSDIGGTVNLNANKDIVISAGTYGMNGNGGVINATGKTINVSSNATGINAISKITLNGETISVSGRTTYGIAAQKNANVKLDGTDVAVTGGQYSIFTIGATVDVNGKNIDVGGSTGNTLRVSNNGDKIGTIKLTAQDDVNLTDETAKDIIWNKGSTVDVSGNNIEIAGGKSDAIYVRDGGTVNLTARGDVDITSRADYAIWAHRGKTEDADGKVIYTDTDGGLVNIEADSVKINGLGNQGAILAQNVTTEEKTNKLATINIKANDIEINSASNAIVAMSQGVVTLDGNTKLNAQNAIQARGNAQVTINKSGDHTTEMNGNIAFGYNDETSGTGIDSQVDITFAGQDSVWNGNTIALWDTKPTNSNKLKVNQTTITLTDGATWNATKINDNDTKKSGHVYVALNNLNIDNGTVNIADTGRGIWIDNADVADATFNGGPLQINKEMNVTGGTNTINANIMGVGSVNVADGATLNIGDPDAQQSSITVDADITGTGTLKVGRGTTLNIGDNSTIAQSSIVLDGTMIANVAEHDGAIITADTFTGDGNLSLVAKSDGDYKLFGNTAFNNVDSAVYDVTFADAKTVSLTMKSVDEIAADNGLSANTAQTVVNLTNSSSDTLNDLAVAAQEQLAIGNSAAVTDAHTAINPTDASVVQSIAANVQGTVSKLAAGRMSLPAIGRAGGDADMTAGGVWAQGLFNKSKKNGEFNGYTRGLAFGVDGTVGRTFTIGAGYTFNHSDVDIALRDTEIESNTLFAYGQYKPSKWYANAILNYTMSDYTERANALGVAVNSDYKITSFGGQIATGYDFASGITPEIGLRYMHVGGQDYTNSLGISNNIDSADYLTAIAGVKYDTIVAITETLTLRPELRASAMYDLMSDDYAMAVVMPGIDAYGVRAESLDRFGGTAGIGVTMTYMGVDVSLNYDIEVRTDYTSQTGMLRARYNF